MKYETDAYATKYAFIQCHDDILLQIALFVFCKEHFMGATEQNGILRNSLTLQLIGTLRY